MERYEGEREFTSCARTVKRGTPERDLRPAPVSARVKSDSTDSTYLRIKSMEVRGAGRIARAAVSALRDYSESGRFSSTKEFYAGLEAAGERLKSARPTAVSLPNAVGYVLAAARRNDAKGVPVREAARRVREVCDGFITSSLKATEMIGEYGAKRVQDGDVIMTHCNSEAVSAVLISAHEAGKKFEVVATETRPRFQGRITASVLAKKGLDVSLIPDSAARVYMRKVDFVLVGADAIAANGAVINKIGTSQVALVAHETRARFYVAAETYKLSGTTMTGELVEIEHRSPYEVVPRAWLDANKAVKVKNPAFDVTPPEYVDLIITEKGVFPPQGIIFLMKELYDVPKPA
ncbi:MAG: ribose 1,5-bisphosphate isomerase [Nitrososphaerota archaeon]|nr:ribose 1,5-bisphosphate isomerase [Nitrososphaerota archaeon]MDG6954917.1 ribose 1,5-bisphosphate isomerase [Nitrososphaerota archaeon]